jgi:hypothetical protein
LVVGLAAWTAPEVDRCSREETSWIFAGELQLDVGLEDLLTGGAARVAVFGAEHLVEPTEIRRQAAPFGPTG